MNKGEVVITLAGCRRPNDKDYMRITLRGPSVRELAVVEAFEIDNGTRYDRKRTISDFKVRHTRDALDASFVYGANTGPGPLDGKICLPWAPNAGPPSP